MDSIMQEASQSSEKTEAYKFVSKRVYEAFEAFKNVKMVSPQIIVDYAISALVIDMPGTYFSDMELMVKNFLWDEIAKGKIKQHDIGMGMSWLERETDISPVSVLMNDHVCPVCRNDRCSKTEKYCWRCGSSLH